MKQKKIAGLICFLICFGNSVLLAQSNTVTSGGDGSSTDGSVSYSVGQIDYIEATGSGGTANQGVQQPFEFFVLGTDDFANIELFAIVFPNPTTQHVTLKISNQKVDGLSFQLYDLSGRLLLNDTLHSEETTIPMERLSSATYFLAVYNQNTLLKTFKIIKN